MGKEKAIEFVGMHPTLEAYMIYSDGRGILKHGPSEKLKRYLSEP